MPNESLAIAKAIRDELDRDRLAFKRYPRAEITRRYRQATGNPAGRLTFGIASEIDQAISDQGLRTFPSFSDLESPEDEARVFRSATVAASLLDVLLNPSNETDQRLAEITTKVKGMWNWEQ